MYGSLPLPWREQAGPEVDNPLLRMRRLGAAASISIQPDRRLRRMTRRWPRSHQEPSTPPLGLHFRRCIVDRQALTPGRSEGTGLIQLVDPLRHRGCRRQPEAPRGVEHDRRIVRQVAPGKELGRLRRELLRELARQEPEDESLHARQRQARHLGQDQHLVRDRLGWLLLNEVDQGPRRPSSDLRVDRTKDALGLHEDLVRRQGDQRPARHGVERDHDRHIGRVQFDGGGDHLRRQG